MSFKATRWAWEAKLPYLQKYVLLALADMASEGEVWECYPSLMTLSDRTSVSRKALKRAILSLKDKGVINITQRYGISNIYALIPQTTSTLADPSASEGSTPRAPTPVPSEGLAPEREVPSETLHPAPQSAYTPPLRDPLTYKEPINNLSISNKEREQKKTSGLSQKPQDVSLDVFKEWATYKKQVCGKCTQRMIDGIVREAHLAGMTTEAAMVMQMEKGWRGFEASWVKRVESSSSKASSVQPKEQENLPTVYFGKSGPLR